MKKLIIVAFVAFVFLDVVAFYHANHEYRKSKWYHYLPGGGFAAYVNSPNQNACNCGKCGN